MANCDDMCTDPIDLKGRDAGLPDQSWKANESPKSRSMQKMIDDRLGGAKLDQWSGMEGDNSPGRSLNT